jgi:hypothetical protein
MQIIRGRTMYDVCDHRLRRRWRNGPRWCLTQAGANVVMLEAGPMWDSATDSACTKWPVRHATRGARQRRSGTSASSTARSGAGRSRGTLHLGAG